MTLLYFIWEYLKVMWAIIKLLSLWLMILLAACIVVGLILSIFTYVAHLVVGEHNCAFIRLVPIGRAIMYAFGCVVCWCLGSGVIKGIKRSWKRAKWEVRKREMNKEYDSE